MTEKFSFKQCAKNFLDGLLSPIKSMIEHPFITAGAMLGMMGLGLVVGTTIMQGIGLGFFVFGGAYAAYEFGKGIFNFASCAIKGDKDGMENSFKDFGAGVSGVAMTLFGARSTAQAIKSIFSRALKNKIKIGSAEIDIGQNLSPIAKTEEGCQSLRILPDEDVTDIANSIVCMGEHQVRKAISKLTPDELSKLQDHIRQARKVTDDDILRMVSRTYKQEKKEIAKRLGITEAKQIRALDKAFGEVKVDESKDAIAAIVPCCGIEYIISPKKARFVSIAEHLFHTVSGRGEEVYAFPTSSFCGSVEESVYKLAYHEPVHAGQFLLRAKCLNPIRYVASFTKQIVNSCLRYEYGRGIKGFARKVVQGTKGFLLGIFVGIVDYIVVNRQFRFVKVPRTPENMKRLSLIIKALDKYDSSSLGIMSSSSVYADNFLELEPNINSMLRRLQALSRDVKSQSVGKEGLQQRFLNLETELSRESQGYKNPPTTYLQEQYSQIQSLIKEAVTVLGLNPRSTAS